ncbi:type II toxin-antitoxin system RelE/ParE family toxin [Arthrobacter dokdonensis]|uniref:type II toxin-antitoxin system RelE/ParE family toxin n=1 Tax=Arthrobacter dokdonellae TaxID=2211210 RepID=UPI001D13229D
MELLAARGLQLGRPLVDIVVRSRSKNMKEVRPVSSGRSELRVLFAFDSQRQAIWPVAGDGTGTGPSVTRRTFRSQVSCSMIT